MLPRISEWKDLGVPYAPGSFPFGSYNFLGGESIDTMNAKLCQQFKNERYFGTFLFGKPSLHINDPDLLRLIQVKDFDHFVDRNSPSDNDKFFNGGDNDKIWKAMLVSLSGDEWKDVRTTFSPIFTSGKMKGMLKYIIHVSGGLVEELERKCQQGEEFELKDVFGKFSLDALASSAFGVDGESFKNKDSKFVKSAARIFEQTKLDMIIFSLRMIPGVPDLLSFFNIDTNKPKETKFFKDVIMQTIKMRRESKERKNDLIDLMLDAIKEDKAVVEGAETEELDQYEKDMKLNHKRKGKHQLDELHVVSTALILLVAGYDTTGSTLSYLAYELSKNPEIQEKLQEEIDQAFEEAGGKFPDYNVIQSLPYLDMVIFEALRFHSPVGVNLRTVEKDYRLADTGLFLKKGEALSFNAHHLHFLPEHWSHPDEFYPEHFSKEEKANRHPYVFQSFGQGPRACIGMRFALLEAKVGVMAMMRRFSFKPGTKTIEPLVMDSELQIAFPKGGLWANIVARE